MLIPGGVIIFISYITKEAVGMGDGILILVTGVFLGFTDNIVFIMLFFFLCAFFSGCMFIFRKYRLKDKIPFAPFLFLSYLIFIGGGG